MKQKLEKVPFANMSIHTPFKDSKKTNVSGERSHRKKEKIKGVEIELYHCVIVNGDCFHFPATQIQVITQKLY